MQRRRKRLFVLVVPGALTAAVVGIACIVNPNPIETHGCGDNKLECDVFCLQELTDAGFRVYNDALCPRCANDKGECPVGCEARTPQHT